VIDMSSSAPLGTQELGAVLAESGIGLVDAPVSGGVKRAETGDLCVMVGGRDDDIKRAIPILRDLGRSIFRTGPLASGQAMKALNNLVSAAGLLSSIEAMVIGKRFGLDPDLMVDVLNGATGRNNSTENKLKQFVLSRRFDSGFSLDLMVKDLRTAVGLANELGIAPCLGTQILSEAEAAVRALEPGADHTAVAKYMEKVAGLLL
jgi:3-hydroxyisobutyrate dehydrogenase